MIKKAYKTFSGFAKELGSNNIGAHAANAAFFIELSIIPMLGVLCAVIPHVPLTRTDLIKAAGDLLPQAVAPLTVSIINEVYNQYYTMIPLTAIATLWSAARGLLAIIRGLNAINKVTESRNFILLRLEASAYTIAVLVVVLLSIGIMIYGDSWVALLPYAPKLRNILENILAFRFIYGWVILSAIFAVLYRFLPNKKMKFKQQIPGATFTGIVWSIFSYGFSLYTTKFKPFGMYGSLTTIVIFTLWLYNCMYIFMIGAQINKYLEENENVLSLKQ